jgi:hypothetical protein
MHEREISMKITEVACSQNVLQSGVLFRYLLSEGSNVNDLNMLLLLMQN